MLWVISALIGIAAAAVQYARVSAPSPARRFGLGALRAIALAMMVGLLLDAPSCPPPPQLPHVFVDASLSMGRGAVRGAADALWRTAWDSAAAIRAESTWVFGDSVRPGVREQTPVDITTGVRSVVERSIATGRPAVLVTDGEVRDTGSLDQLPPESRVIVLDRDGRGVGGVDLAVSAVSAPRAVVEGDSLTIRVLLASGARGSSAGSLSVRIEGEELGEWPVGAMSPWSEREVDVRVRASSARGPAALAATVESGDDVEPRNDTLIAVIEISRAASAVFVSTSPDQDARFALAVLRGALSLPTRGYFRVAPGMWRREGTLAAASEAEIRQAMRDAPIAILHGDTSIFGPPRSATTGPLALMVPPEAEDGEWYASATPLSPLSAALAAIPMDSLPPISVGVSAGGDWVALEARRGRTATRRPVVVGHDAPRRSVTVTGAGMWRWSFRGGASADAFAALWGGIFDWLAAERADRRGAVPDLMVVRAGQPVRWRRGSAADSIVHVTLRSGQSRDLDTLDLRFGPGQAVTESPPLPPGRYDVAVSGGRALLIVNAPVELLPNRPTIETGAVGGRGTGSRSSRSVRRNAALYALVIGLLCAEWLLRRRAGLR